MRALRPHRPGRDVRVLDLADPADPGAARTGPPRRRWRRRPSRSSTGTAARTSPPASRELLASRHGNALRGGVLVIASDGWDSDDPERLAAVMARIRLRAHRVVWLNPRAAAPGFEPLVGSMAAALPLCDAFLPAHTAAGADRRRSTRSCPGGRLAPERDVHRRPEPADGGRRRRDHRLGGARRGDEAEQLGGRRRWLCGGSAIAAHRPWARRPGPSRATSRPAARSPATANRTASAMPVAALGLLERGRVALEDPLVRLGDARGGAASRDDPVARRPRTARASRSARGPGRAVDGAAGQRVAGARRRRAPRS